MTKTDGSTQISGATFTLYDDTKAVTTFTGGSFEISTADEALKDVLPAAGQSKTLTLKETGVPAGYTGSDAEYKLALTASAATAWNEDKTKLVTTTTYTITINDQKSATVVNLPVPGTNREDNAVTVTKTNGSTQISGATFTLYDGTTEITTFTGGSFEISTANEALQKFLPTVGKSKTLILKETKAPSGYVLSNTEYKVILKTTVNTAWNANHTMLVTTTTHSIAFDNQKTELTVVNEPETTTPPTTPPDDDVPPPAPTPTPTVDISGTKVWVDDGNIHKVRPDSITVTLLADGSPVSATPSWSKSGDRWTFTFSGLPKVNSSGSEISYSVQESPVDLYESTVSGMTITNKLIPREPEKYTDLSGEKTWNDNNNASGKRPTSITVRLLRDGVEVESRTVTAGTDWKYTFSNLPVDDGYGNTYTYELREDGVPGYYARIDGMNVTNTVIDGSTPPTPTRDGETPPPEGVTPNVPQKPEDIPERKTGTPVPHFEEMADEELEELFDLFGYGTPLYGMLGTGDQIPVWVWICAGAGVLALIAFIATGRKKKKAK